MPDSDTPSLPLDAPRRWTLAGDIAPTQKPLFEKPAADTAVQKLELFQTAAEKTDDGYSRWKAEIAAERQTQQAAKRASELPMDTAADGYAAWKEDAEKARQAFEQRWGVPIGKAVRLQLRGEAHEREGVLRIGEEPSTQSTRQLRLQLGGHSFSACQIESLVRL